jgi:hypothetical protein
MANLFNQLFTFRPREDSSANENFLTESFVYFLQRDKDVCEAFVARVLGREIKIVGYELDTRSVERLPGRTRFPDLKMLLHVSDGKTYLIISEHKWDSAIRQPQLADYEEILESITADCRHLVTIVARADQKKAAQLAPTKSPTIQRTHLLWEDVYRVLKHLDRRDSLPNEFLEFMESNSLNPGQPINSETMRAFLASSDFKAQLTRYTKLLHEYDWEAIPTRYRAKPEIRDRFGRVAIEFRTPGWNPALAVGFLYDIRDHLVELTSPNESVDLFLRIEADPRTNEKIDDVLALLRQKAQILSANEAKALIRDEPENGNRWTLLIVQQSLASVITGASDERAQLEAIYNRIHEWLACVFDDVAIERALGTLKPIKSAIEPEAAANPESS